MSYTGQNKGYKYMLTVIDIFSKFAWAKPIKSKSGNDVTKTVKYVLLQRQWFSLQGSYKWLDILPDSISTYDKKHETIQMEPSDVTIANERLLLRQAYGGLRAIPTKSAKFKSGDKVRISEFKNVFEKGDTPIRTTEIFTISRVENTNPVTYKLKDYQDQSIASGFYERELLKVEHPDIDLAEKVLKKCGKNYTLSG
ncbi:uncharacterized protein [Neodiprion pinetum]|uniref:uncharacterized protein n=1 Tax=Neodiprion pinetum TaxID=441929 RepID=UPI0037126AD6